MCSTSISKNKLHLDVVLMANILEKCSPHLSFLCPIASKFHIWYAFVRTNRNQNGNCWWNTWLISDLPFAPSIVIFRAKLLSEMRWSGWCRESQPDRTHTQCFSENIHCHLFWFWFPPKTSTCFKWISHKYNNICLSISYHIWMWL